VLVLSRTKQQAPQADEAESRTVACLLCARRMNTSSRGRRRSLFEPGPDLVQEARRVRAFPWASGRCLGRERLSHRPTSADACPSASGPDGP